jgi:3-oxoadipate enol-lactonase
VIPAEEFGDTINSVETTIVNEHRSATTSDGTRLAYQLRTGTASGRQLVLVHALAMSYEFWDEVIDSLPDEIDVLALDCRGHGKSDKPAGPYRIETFADDVAEVLDDVGWDKAVVAGCSMGGCVALALADRHSLRVSALGLIDTTAWYGPEASKQWAKRAEMARQHGLSSLLDFQRTRWVSDDFRSRFPEKMARLEATFLANDIHAYEATCAMLGNCDLRSALPRVAVSASVLVGEEDYATPPTMAQMLCDGVRGSNMSVLPKVRHFSPVEVPVRIADELSKLVESGVRSHEG